MMEERDIFDERIIPDYGKINALGHFSLKELFLDEIIAQEKVDGSQFSFGVIDGILRTRSRGREIFMDAPDAMFKLGVEYVKSIQDRLVPNWIYRGEYLCKPKHSSLTYSRIPNNHIALFDVMTGHQQFAYHTELPTIAAELGIEAVPTLYSGMMDMGKFQALMNTESFLGGQQIEGMVVKNYHRYSLQTGKVLMGKYVSEKFKEVHRNEWNGNSANIIETIIGMFKTPARFEKAVYRLRDQGELENSPRDIGKLIRSIWPDVEAECEDEIRDMLYKHFKKDIAKGVCRGFPEWYKERLLHEQFANDQEQSPPVEG